jgi:glycosyltransferase involved in cell wall biosynthesis
MLRAAMAEILPSLDIVHTQMPFVYPTQLAARMAIKAGTPVFYHQRGVLQPEHLRYRGLKKRIYIRLVELPIMRRAAGLIALTARERDAFLSFGVKSPCHIVPNGVDVNLYADAPGGAAGADLGLPSGRKYILFMGRLHPTKGVDLLGEAFVKIADAHPDAMLVLAGPDEQNRLDDLLAQFRSRGLADRVLACGMVMGERKLELLARADLFVLPSAGEGLSIAVLEALASRTAVVLSPECHMPIVEEAGAGTVVERNADRIAETLDRYLSDDALLSRTKHSAYVLARDHFDWGRILDQMEGIYSDATRARSAA